MIADSNIHWAVANEASGAGALILAGSSGRIDTARAEMLASRGVAALALRRFGGDAQPEMACEIPLEPFIEAIDRLADQCSRIVIISSRSTPGLETVVEDASPRRGLPTQS